MATSLEQELRYAAKGGFESESPHFVLVTSTPYSYSRFVGIEVMVALFRETHRHSGIANMHFKACRSNTLVGPGSNRAEFRRIGQLM